MPVAPFNTKCRELGCNNTRSKLNSFCLQHGGRNYDDRAERKQFNSNYQTAAWRRMRTAQLSKQPLCQCCLLAGKIAQATDVDHVFSWNRIGREAFRLNIFQSLCHECHSVKTNLEIRGIYRYYGQQQVDYGIADYVRVVARV